MKKRCVRLGMIWTPRELNCEADRPSNGDLSGFMNCNLTAISMKDVDGIVLPRLMEHGVGLVEERGAMRKQKLRTKKGNVIFETN